MPAGREKSGRFRKVYVKAPGGANKVHYRKRKPQRAHCPVFGTVLPGVARELPSKMRNMPKTAKRPERPYGGVLSSKALRVLMKDKARNSLEDATKSEDKK